MTTAQHAVRASIPSARRYLTTDELAALSRVKAQTIRKRYCQTGSYFGLKPVKHPNGRLLWPDDSMDQLAGAQ
ncbi:DNA-binding protein [Burkholderia ambifaria]|uniref:DNA-binding protein n=1 Tax=Burkholderia ambifaria TaxID=152480 RepID=UPI001E4735CD|nr:DNA-binding protein [Burkholderia ambifaria]UEP35956.1 DNA-binding protein [Burkholderia ambifaria]